MNDKLTPEAEAMICDRWDLYRSRMVAAEALTSPELLKAQGLITREQVEEIIKALSIKIQSQAWQLNQIEKQLGIAPPKTEP